MSSRPSKWNIGIGTSVTGFLLILVASVLGGGVTQPPETTEAIHRLRIVVAVLGIAGVACLVGAKKVGGWWFENRYRRWFAATHPEINLEAVDKTVASLKARTNYMSAGKFSEVANTIRAISKIANPDDTEKHSAWSWEAWRCYKHFASGEGEIPETSCPRK